MKIISQLTVKLMEIRTLSISEKQVSVSKRVTLTGIVKVTIQSDDIWVSQSTLNFQLSF